MGGFVNLDRCGGPACPLCGCRETRQYRGRRRWGGAEYIQYVCGHCGKVFYPDPRWKPMPTEGRSNGSEAATTPTDPLAEPEKRSDGAVIYRVIRCPACGSDKTKVYRTRRPVRYHKCRGCGENFKSIEEPAPSS